MIFRSRPMYMYYIIYFIKSIITCIHVLTYRLEHSYLLKQPLKLRKLHTTSEYVFATSGLRTNVIPTRSSHWTQCSFNHRFCALMHQSNRICSWWPIALYQRISLLQTNIWRSFLRGQFVPFKSWHIMRYQILSQWTSVQITSAPSAKCL